MSKNTFGIRCTQYSIELSVHKQPRVFNTTYTIKCHMNCPYVFKSCLGFVLSNCANKCFHMFFKSCVGFLFGFRNTQYIIALSIHKQPSVFNTLLQLNISITTFCIFQPFLYSIKMPIQS